MLTVSFLGGEGQQQVVVQLADELYLWLAQSQFSKIGQSQTIDLDIEGESVSLPLVVLDSENRPRLRDFFYQAVVEESDSLLERLGDYPSKEVYQSQTYRLRKLQELRKHVENEQFQYLQRV
ncbi:MAG: hypothetical protein AAGG51_10210 [Cyanobacteria bacterium P01_G01_bin.54]